MLLALALPRRSALGRLAAIFGARAPLPVLAAAGAAGAAGAVAAFATTNRFRGPQPFSKRAIRGKRPRQEGWASYNLPSLDGKFLRFAERVARETGAADALREFDAAAAASGLPRAPRVLAATLLERSNVVMRDVESWEAQFLALARERRTREAKHYPQALLDLWTANERVVGGGGGGGGGGSGSSGDEKAGAGAAGDAAAPAAAAAAAAAEGGSAGGKAPAKAAKGAAAASAPGTAAPAAAAATAAAAAAAAPAAAARKGAAGSGSAIDLSSFYEQGSASAARGAADSGAGLQATSRVTAADQINDTRSLDRAYSQRLVLLVRDAATGEWGMPAGERLEGETMQQAAERHMRACFAAGAAGEGGAPAAPPPSLWYVGQTPVGHWLRVYPPELQKARGCYGEKVFFYRAEIMAGRFRLKAGAEAAAKAKAAATAAAAGGAAASSYDDFRWLTRDEAEGVLARPFWKYAHQMIGAGAGEEAARAAAWRAAVAKEGVPLASAVARRARRVRAARRAGLRPRVIVTAAAAELAAQPRSAAKRALTKEAVDAYHERVREARAVSAALRAGLRSRPAVELLRERLVAARAAAVAGGGAGGA
jgi:hypothetical protein